MWIGLAIIVWLWVLVLYLVAFYVVVPQFTAGELHELLGQEFYNSHIPNGGWLPAACATLVFAATLIALQILRRPLAVLGQRLESSFGIRRPLLAVVGTGLLAVAWVPPADRLVETMSWSCYQAYLDFDRWLHPPPPPPPPSPFVAGEGMVAPVETYVRCGTGLWSEVLLLGGDSRYRRAFSGCMGGVQHEDDYVLTEDMLRLEHVNEDPMEPSYDGFPRDLRVVTWGDRRYLIEEYRGLEFCNAVNAGVEPRDAEGGAFFVRRDDLSRQAVGNPNVPEAWRPWLVTESLIIKTTELDPDGTTWIDAGSADGLQLGMVLFLPNAPSQWEWHDSNGGGGSTQPLEIVEVEAERSRVRYRYGSERRPPIPPGLIVTLRFETDA